jgi:hypothetical protein
MNSSFGLDHHPNLVTLLREAGVVEEGGEDLVAGVALGAMASQGLEAGVVGVGLVGCWL